MRHFIIAVVTAVLFVSFMPIVSDAQQRPNTGITIPAEDDDKPAPTATQADTDKKPRKAKKAEEAPPPPAAPTVVEVDLTPVIILIILLALISIAALIFALVAFVTTRRHQRAIAHLIRHLPQEESHGG